jgi:hypothetical protein
MSINKHFPTWTIPLALLIICILAFGLLIPFLGLYWDDWPAIMTMRLQEPSAFWDFYANERPFTAWTFYLLGPILGTKPLVWHIFALLVRWLTVVGMWATLRLIWPNRLREVTWMAVLFAVYPVFTQQTVAVVFTRHWSTFALYFLSLLAMILSVRKPGWYWPFTLLGVLTAAVQLFTMEYFVGLELLRPIILWILLSESMPRYSQRLKKTLLYWLPYIFIFIVFIVWRLFIFQVEGEDPNRPSLLFDLTSQPLGTLLRLFQISVQDLIYNQFGSWFPTFDPRGINFSERTYLLGLFISILSAVLVFFYLYRLRASERKDPIRDARWLKQALFLGLLAAILGSLPVWVTDRQVFIGLQSGRFALAAMFGLSILSIAILEWFTPRTIPKLILIGVLVGLAVGFHIQNSVSYYRSTLKQNQFYWQLSWRAPDIKPHTAILSADELFPYVGREPTAMALNLLYPQERNSYELDYWFLELYHNIGPKAALKLPKGKPLNPTFRIYSFNGSSLDSLVIYAKSGNGRCLWVLSPQDVDNPEIPDLTRAVVSISNFERIETSSPEGNYPPVELFGKEPAREWCYFYQKAELARQQGKWEEIILLGKEAEKLGFSSNYPHEMLPFIEAFAYTGLWQEAIELTSDAYEINPDYATRLCNFWDHLEQNISLPTEFEEDVEYMRAQIQCELVRSGTP